MKDEIKKILECIKDKKRDYVGTNGCLYQDLDRKELNLLLDYITNLQEELKEYKMLFDAFSKRPYAHRYLEEKKKEIGNSKIIGLDSEMIYKDYYDLQEENERLKEWKEDLLKENIELENTRKEAIEYIKLGKTFENEEIRRTIERIQNDLLNILNGDDKYE